MSPIELGKAVPPEGFPELSDEEVLKCVEEALLEAAKDDLQKVEEIKLRVVNYLRMRGNVGEEVLFDDIV